MLREYQGKGLGKANIREIVKYLVENVPQSDYVSLIADGKAHELYQQFGFVPTAPRSVGMAWKKRRTTRLRICRIA